MPNTADYKSKYLDLLDEHEQAHKQQNTQIKLLKKAIFNLGVAAKEQDANLDAAISGLQSSLKEEQANKVYESIEGLQKIILAFDEKKEDERKTASTVIADFLHELQALSLPDELQSTITDQKKILKRQVNNHTELLETMANLHHLQKNALAHIQSKKPSLWQKLKKPANQAQTDYPTTEPDTHSTTVETTDAHNASSSVCQGLAQTEQAQCFADVASRITATLTELMVHIQPTEDIQLKINRVLDRLKKPIDYPTLASILDDIRDILMARYLKSDNDFSHYLESLNTELNSIGNTLGIAKQQGEEHAHIAKDLSNTVSSQVEIINDSVNADDKDLTTIRAEVNSNISTIREALQKFDEHQSNKEQNLTDQLESLLEQVKRIEEDAENSRRQLEEQRHKATHDALTGLPNREAYNQRAYFEARRYARYGHPLTIAICDIDHFKKINDTIGHQAGDKVLKLVSQLIKERLREVDFIARYGGEEFVIIMPETSGETALSVLEKVREAIANMPLKFRQQPISISMCFGIKELNQNDTTDSAFEQADKALYQAKESGRNRCILAQT